ncbi:MAG: orotidine-5'-phosphate decarboxylase [Crocinitomicaceae bacterium]|nr:orotidine-5'-phosphate decarboxylase [Crocinitomicaceae bacterium]|tara:strand:+ start:2655 stop:3458 length:804 start_codon:yes stop_codon:yes gene_type:complete
MKRQELIEQIHRKKSFLCVGLDTDLKKIPKFLLDYEDPIFEFNKRIIDATKDFCVAYKPNIAFYEALGAKGWISLEKTLNYIPNDIFTIADAKRGDIGNTSALYASTFFKTYPFDSVTIAPYMGVDSITPFLEYENKWTILLALTSNLGSKDFQTQLTFDNEYLYEKVLKASKSWGSIENTMYVVGATKAELLSDIRKIIPDHFLLVPGVGAQGGSLESVAKYGINKDVGLLVNSSRGIIYSGNSNDFDVLASESARSLQKQMANFL